MGIPPKCPQCGKTEAWQEQLNIFTSGIPVGNRATRIRLLVIRGLWAEPIKKRLGFYKVTYRCKSCGYTARYDLYE